MSLVGTRCALAFTLFTVAGGGRSGAGIAGTDVGVYNMSKARTYKLSETYVQVVEQLQVIVDDDGWFGL